MIKWVYKPLPDKETVRALSKAINVSPRLASILIQRGITTYEAAKKFFRPSMDDLHDPFLMKDMDKAVNRLNTAIANKEKILIYGDYDVDGSTSVSLVYGFLRTVYPELDYYIPDRYTEGYGISYKGIDYAEEQGISLIISLDCGIKAVDKVAYARQKNIDFIICDHHRPGEALPAAVAVLDPKQDDCQYPFDELCGCGVGFKFMQAFCIQNTISLEKLFHFLDLVAIGTASDIVPIEGENRTLVHFGIKKINTDPIPGVKSLIKLAGFEQDLSVMNIVFGIGPRINAAGRIHHAHGAVKLLLENDEAHAVNFAKTINQHNTDRKTFDRSITKEALEMIGNDEKLKGAKTTVLSKDDWHKGVIGIVASRCIETYYRPTIIMTESNGKLTGSARSVEGFDIYNAISACDEYLEQFGGHKYAAGLTLEKANFDAFAQKFEEVVSATITDEQLIPRQEVDMELDFYDINFKFFNIIEQMAPFGPCNMEPVFVSRGIRDTGKSKVVKEEHLKFSIAQEHSPALEGIGFGLGHHYDKVRTGQPFDVCYTIDKNTFRGNTRLQLMVKDIKFPEDELQE